MTTPAGTDEARSARELQRARKQLDDLDSLLEQMLALPISDRPRRPDESAPSPREQPVALLPKRPPSPPARGAARAVVFIPPGGRLDPPPVSAPPDQQPHLELILDPPSPTGGQEMHVLDEAHDEILVPTAPRQLNVDPTRVDVRAPSEFDLSAQSLLDLVGMRGLESEHPSVAPQSPGLLQSCFMGINAVYDWLADLCWPLSGLLKWSGTRNLLGVIGLVLLLAAAAWYVLTLAGWPVPLAWLE